MIGRLLLFIILLNGVFSQAQEGTVLNIENQGAKRTKTSFLKKLIALKPGMVLDSVLLEQDIARL